MNYGYWSTMVDAIEDYYDGNPDVSIGVNESDNIITALYTDTSNVKITQVGAGWYNGDTHMVTGFVTYYDDGGNPFPQATGFVTEIIEFINDNIPPPSLLSALASGNKEEAKALREIKALKANANPKKPNNGKKKSTNASKSGKKK